MFTCTTKDLPSDMYGEVFRGDCLRDEASWKDFYTFIQNELYQTIITSMGNYRCNHSYDH